MISINWEWLKKQKKLEDVKIIEKLAEEDIRFATKPNFEPLPKILTNDDTDFDFVSNNLFF